MSLGAMRGERPVRASAEGTTNGRAAPLTTGASLAEEAAAPTPAPVRLLAGRWELLEVVGRGGMGDVYRARDLELGRFVAVKLLGPALLQTPDAVTRFEAEARQTVEHAHIVNVAHVGRAEDGRPFYVMELLQGRTLREVLQAEGPFSVERAVWVMAQILLALSEAHKRVVHRDLKPANVMLVRMGDIHDFVKVLDFGIAKALSGEQPITLENLAVGTPAYMAPEVASGAARGADPRMDIYAAGLILFELLVGESPWAGRTPQETLVVLAAGMNPPPLRSRRPDAPEWLERVLGRALAADPGERYQTAAEFREALLAGEQAPDLEDLPPGFVVDGKYRIEEKVGRGGWAVVYRVHDLVLDRVCALKLLVLPDGVELDPTVRPRFAQDAALAASVDHPHVVRVHAGGEWRGTLYILMEYVAGDTLRDKWEEIDLQEFVRVVGEVAEALDAVHARGIVHRDLTPENILIDRETDAAKLLDFGIARAAASELTRSSATYVLGRFGYMAPEQVIDPRRVSPATDQWSLAAIAYEWLTGALPFDRVEDDGDEGDEGAVGGDVEEDEGELARRIVEGAEVVPPRVRNPEVPAAVGTVLLRALARETGARYATARDFAGELAAAVEVRVAAGSRGAEAEDRAGEGEATAAGGGVGVMAGRVAAGDGPEPERRFVGPWRWVAVAGVVGAVALAVAVVAVSVSRGRESPAVAPAAVAPAAVAPAAVARPSGSAEGHRAETETPAALAPDRVVIEVRSVPEGATLAVGDERWRLPARLERAPGERLTGTASAEGFAEKSVELMFDEGGVVTVELEPEGPKGVRGESGVRRLTGAGSLPDPKDLRRRLYPGEGEVQGAEAPSEYRRPLGGASPPN